MTRFHLPFLLAVAALVAACAQLGRDAAADDDADARPEVRYYVIADT